MLDVGAGPGYATIDLAEKVGASGEVLAIERSDVFVKAAATACAQRGLSQVRIVKLDLMTDPIPTSAMDAAWCRWVASFVSSPRILAERIAVAVKEGGVAIFHEYVDYSSWRMVPPRPAVDEFVRQVVTSWRDKGGEPDVAPALIGHLTEAGFVVREATPRVFCVRPGDDIWGWPSAFLEVNLSRLLELGRVDRAWVEWVRHEFRAAEANPNSLMITPMLLEVVAERRS